MSSSKPRAMRAPSRIDLRVALRLRERRRDRGMTLMELGAQIGLSHQQLQKYENGANRISAGILYEVSQVLGVPIAAFFDGEDPRRNSQVSRLRREARRIIDTVPEADLCQVVKVLRAMRRSAGGG